MLILQEFNTKIKDKKGVENSVADHLSQIERESDPMLIRDEFPDEQLLHINTSTPWFAHLSIDFIRPFPVSNGYSYILLIIDYVSRWVKAIATKTNDAKVVEGEAKQWTSRPINKSLGPREVVSPDRLIPRLADSTSKQPKGAKWPNQAEQSKYNATSVVSNSTATSLLEEA
ncbi:hypothetical protein CR513_25505, partial [Mucuna pruriens]